MQLTKYKHDVTLVQRVKFTDLKVPIKGYVTFMTCDNTMCLPPTDVDFKFDLSKISKTEMMEFLSQEFPQVNFELEAFDKDSVTIRRRVGPEDLRPGGTV